MRKFPTVFSAFRFFVYEIYVPAFLRNCGKILGEECPTWVFVVFHFGSKVQRSGEIYSRCIVFCFGSPIRSYELAVDYGLSGSRFHRSCNYLKFSGNPSCEVKA